MPKVFITDEVNDSYVADVFKSGALETLSYYNYIGVPSGTASGNLLPDGDIILHTVNITNTATKAIFTLGDHLSADGSAATVAGVSASAICIIDCTVRGSYLFDCFVDKGLQYRLSGIDLSGIVVTYHNLA